MQEGKREEGRFQANAVPLTPLDCFWIDSQLASIESRAASWFARAQSEYQGRHGSNPAATVWLQSEMASAGPIQSGLQFPRASGLRQSPNGVWRQSNYDGLWKHGKAGPW